MKSSVKLVSMALLPIVMLAGGGCTNSGMKGDEEINTVAMDNGVMVVDTLTVNATVVSKDLTKGKITLASDMGGKSTYKVGKDVDDISGIDVGERVTAVVTEEVAISFGTVVPDTVAAAGGVVVAPDGSIAGYTVESIEMTAVVASIDAKKRKVTFELQDGSSKTVKVSKDLDLSLLPVGEMVTVQVAEGLALSIEN